MVVELVLLDGMHERIDVAENECRTCAQVGGSVSQNAGRL